MEFHRSTQCISFSCSLPNITCTELCEMVSVLVCILPSLVSVESMSWRQFLPLPHSPASSLPNPPTRPPDIRNSVYSALWLLERGAHQEHLSTLWGKDNQHLPSPAADSPCSVTSMNPFEVPRWICVQMCFYQLMCFSHLLCLARDAAYFGTLLFPVKNLGELVLEFRDI